MVKSVSVALATYNGALFLQKQLDSIAQQTRKPDELVITDDASSDATLDIARAFAETAPFATRIHRNETRLGYRANFMHALSLCRSDLIALCDQDDIWEPEKLAIAQAALTAQDTLFFFHNAWLIDRDGNLLGPAAIFSAPYASNPPLSHHSLINPFGFSTVFDRWLLQFSDLWERSVATHEDGNRMPHDQWLYFLASVFGTIAYCDKPLTRYRQHGGNVYGFAAVAGLRGKLQRFLYRLTNHGPEYGLLAKAAQGRATTLRDAQLRLTGLWLDRAKAGEAACARLAHRLALREELYGPTPIRRRAAILAQLHRTGAYAHDGGFGLGRAALTKDLAAALFLKPLLRPAKPRKPLSELPAPAPPLSPS